MNRKCWTPLYMFILTTEVGRGMLECFQTERSSFLRRTSSSICLVCAGLEHRPCNRSSCTSSLMSRLPHGGSRPHSDMGYPASAAQRIWTVDIGRSPAQIYDSDIDRLFSSATQHITQPPIRRRSMTITGPAISTVFEGLNYHLLGHGDQAEETC